MVTLGQESENNGINQGIPPKKKLTYDNNEDEVSTISPTFLFSLYLFNVTHFLF